MLLVTFAGWVSRQQAEVMSYLIEENRVLKESLTARRRRLKLTDEQRRRLAAKGKPLGRKVLSQIATIVTPDTILKRHEREDGRQAPTGDEAVLVSRFLATSSVAVVARPV